MIDSILTLRTPHFCESREGRDARPAGGEHRIDDQRDIDRLGLRQLAVILDGPGRFLVAIQAQVPDFGGRNQIQDRIYHS